MLEGALILSAGVVIGRFLPARRRRPQPPPPIKPVCGCAHHRSYHKDGGRCTFVSPMTGRCGCGEYVGPQPIPEFYAPEIGAAP